MTTTVEEELDAHQATVEAPVGFTPGPWFVSGNPYYRGVVYRYNNNDGLGDRDGLIAEMGVRGNHDAVQLANAKLIAMAPDLLSERNRLREALEFYADAEVYKAQRGWCPARGEIQKASDIQIDNYGDRAREALGAKQP